MSTTFAEETRSTRRRKGDRWDDAKAALIREITGAAERIVAAKTRDGESVVRVDGVSVLLRAIERSPYCCSLSDAGRLLRISRQQAQRLARKAERAGAIELARNYDDRRIVQLLLTPRGRAELENARREEKIWMARLLLGLDMPSMATATHVVRVIRERLARAERERQASRRD